MLKQALMEPQALKRLTAERALSRVKLLQTLIAELLFSLGATELAADHVGSLLRR